MTNTQRFTEGQRVFFQGKPVVVTEDEGEERVQIEHPDGSYSYVSRWNLRPTKQA